MTFEPNIQRTQMDRIDVAKTVIHEHPPGHEERLKDIGDRVQQEQQELRSSIKVATPIVKPETKVKKSEVAVQTSHVDIAENCHNCHKPNLINRPARKDVFCGWCGTTYKRSIIGKLLLYEIHNNHLTKRLKEKLRAQSA